MSNDYEKHIFHQCRSCAYDNRFLNFEITYFAFFLKLYNSRGSVFPPFLPLLFHLLNVFREKITERHHLANQLMKLIMFFLLLCGRVFISV